MFLLFLIWFLLKACQNHAIDKKSAKFVSFGVTADNHSFIESLIIITKKNTFTNFSDCTEY